MAILLQKGPPFWLPSRRNHFQPIRASADRMISYDVASSSVFFLAFSHRLFRPELGKKPTRVPRVVIANLQESKSVYVYRRRLLFIKRKGGICIQVSLRKLEIISKQIICEKNGSNQFHRRHSFPFYFLFCEGRLTNYGFYADFSISWKGTRHTTTTKTKTKNPLWALRLMGLFCDVAMVVTSQVNGVEKNMANAERGDIFSGKKVELYPVRWSRYYLKR